MLTRYFLIGILNTTVHWLSFGLCVVFLDLGQGLSNVVGFLISASLSYVLNAKFNFKVKLKYLNYFIFLLALGSLSYFIGSVCDELDANPVLTLVLSSFLNFILGFYFSKFYIFRGK